MSACNGRSSQSTGTSFSRPAYRRWSWSTTCRARSRSSTTSAGEEIKMRMVFMPLFVSIIHSPGNLGILHRVLRPVAPAVLVSPVILVAVADESPVLELSLRVHIRKPCRFIRCPSPMPRSLSHIYLVLLNNLYPPQRASGKSFFTKPALLQAASNSAAGRARDSPSGLGDK